MIYFGTSTVPTVTKAMQDGLIGQMCQPNVGGTIRAREWAADNGCFSDRWNEIKWTRWLERQPRTCHFAVVPDVVGDHAATVERWSEYSSYVTGLGFKAAFVAQDGCELGDVPAEAECLFIGGSTEFKLSETAKAIALDSRAAGRWVHMGRVNSRKRCLIAHEFGCHSVDGTLISFGPDVHLPRVIAWMEEINEMENA